MGTPTGDADGRDRVRTLARILLTETREEMAKADQKAGVLLSVLAVALATLVATVVGGGVTPLAYGSAAQLLFWAGCATAIPSLVMLGLAVVPRAGVPRYGRAHYFGDMTRGMPARALRSVILGTDPVERDLSQFTELSRLITVKYSCIRHSMVWGGSFLALTCSGVLVGVVG